MFPPITLSLSYDDILFTTIDVFNIFEYVLSLSSFSFLYTLKLPSNILSQDKLPVVIVPVLSLNNIFIHPAVSIPTIFLTKTLFLSILFIFDDKTRVIIIGSPSGTETIMMVTASVRAYIT